MVLSSKPLKQRLPIALVPRHPCFVPNHSTPHWPEMQPILNDDSYPFIQSHNFPPIKFPPRSNWHFALFNVPPRPLQYGLKRSVLTPRMKMKGESGVPWWERYEACPKRLGATLDRGIIFRVFSSTRWTILRFWHARTAWVIQDREKTC